MNTKENRRPNGRKTTQFLFASFTLLLILSIGSFTVLGFYMNKVSKTAINKVGNLYMTGINDHITARFKTLIDLKLEQAENVVKEAEQLDKKDNGALHNALISGASVRNFNHLALCDENGNMEMLLGSQIKVTDPEPFFTSIKNNENKVAVGSDSEGADIVLFEVNAVYPMQNNKKSTAMVVTVPIDYISTILITEEENALVSYHIIRKDGSFIVNNTGAEYANYFNSLPMRYENKDDKSKIDAYVKKLSAAMENKENYSAILNFGGSTQQIFCTSLPYSEWHLITVMPFGSLNETVEKLNNDRTAATILVCAVILSVLLLIFAVYYKMTCRQMKELDAAREDALAATKAKSLFLSNMSHDIRTPMNAIVGMTAIAMAHIDDKDQVRNCLKKITISGRHLLGLINDVLDMSKIENGKMTLTAEHISLREVVDGVVGIVQTQIKAKNQSFNVHIDRIAAEDVYCDSVRLNQVLLNLLSNAVKYTQEGGVIQLYLYQEEAPEDKGDNYIRTHIIVRDNGIGMTPEFLEHVFDSYTRADSKRINKTEGAGLGMAITKRIIDAMQGTITVKSTIKVGSEFHVVLDFEKAASEEIDMILPAWKMLVVDDDEILCRTAVDSLESIGIQADWTLSGEKAIEMITKHHQANDNYQIVLLDWKLPGMDGIWVAKQIRKIMGDEMPIILISAYDWSDFEEEAIEAGINGFISKPLFKSTLFHGLKKYMTPSETSYKIEKDTELSGKRILVAEDNELNWEIVNDLMSDLGLQLEWAENGQVCLEKLQSSEPGYYDAILMDVRMPVLNGLEATEKIRALEREDAKSIPIIAMTADAFSEDIKRCLESGMNAHTAKPINLDEMVSILKKYI